MKIELKQAEITAALAQYISGKGISLTGKAMSVTFTAGRKQSGISAELTIDEDGIPDFEEFNISTPIPVAEVVEEAPTPVSAPVDQAPVTEDTPKTVSLFA